MCNPTFVVTLNFLFMDRIFILLIHIPLNTKVKWRKNIVTVVLLVFWRKDDEDDDGYTNQIQKTFGIGSNGSKSFDTNEEEDEKKWKKILKFNVVLFDVQIK